MFNTKKVLVILLALVTLLSFAACGDDSNALDILESVPDIELSKEEVVEESEPDPEPAEGQTRMPVILQSYNKDQTTVVIAGTCEEGATVKASYVGGEVSEVTANGTRFALEVDVGTKAIVSLQITATAPDKTESEPKVLECGYEATAEDSEKYPTVLGDGVNLFFKDSLAALSEEAVVPNSTTDKLVSRIDTYVKNLAKTDSELLYVMVPSKSSYDKDSLPADTVVSEGITLYNQVKAALESSDASLIDMRDTFAEADTSKYPLYYNTHSTMSEYAAYLTYVAIMNHIAEKYAEAAPRDISEFDVKEIKDAIGGDLAYHYKLDEKVFTETVYDFVPKFETALGDKIPEELAEQYTNPVLINQVKQYMAENDYRFYNEYFVSKSGIPDTSVARGDEAFGFFTDRAELPTALIYRDEYSIPMIDMLAERFENSMFESAGKLNLNVTGATDYTSGEEGNVNYIIVILSEDSLTRFLDTNAN